ncbi:Lrp/AsnC family transcriptional regulator, partial [Chloroflexota bacterium]
MKRLLENKIIDIIAIPQLDKLGYGFIGIVGLQVQLANIKTVAQKLVEHSKICYLANVTGRFEFIAVVVSRSSTEYADFMENVISEIPQILRTETLVSLRVYRGRVFELDTVRLITELDVTKYQK